MPSIAYTIDIHEDAWFALHLDGVHQALPEGDFKIVADDKVWLVERKTWGDAYSSWTNKRLQNQISRMVENCDNYVLLVEGSWAECYADPSSIK